jgi:hypothetical protein
MRGVEFPGHYKVNAAIQGHPAMLCQNHISGFLPCQNGTTKNPQICWRRKGTPAPPPGRHRQQTLEPTSIVPGRPPAPTGNTSGAPRSQIVILPAEYTYSHTALPCAGLFVDDENTQHDIDFDPDMLTDER